MPRSLANALVTAWFLGALAPGLVLTAGCHTGRSPELRVVGFHEQPQRDVVFVQVTNPASHSMRLTKLEYTFAAEGATLSTGEVSLAREVAAGAAVVVEIPLDTSSPRPMILSGKLTAELNHIVEIFSVSTQISPSPSPSGQGLLNLSK
jgi:hypothetical protein